MTYSDAILEALAQSGRSGREVSIDAVGHESAIRSLKRGLDLHVSTIQALCRVLGLEFYVGPPRETDERPAQSLPSIPSELHEENTVLPSDIVRESGLSRADRRLLGYVETVLGALDDADFRAAWVSPTRFAHKRLTSGRRSGRDAAQYPPARASCPR